MTVGDLIRSSGDELLAEFMAECITKTTKKLMYAVEPDVISLISDEMKTEIQNGILVVLQMQTHKEG